MYLKRQRDPRPHLKSAISQIDFWPTHGHELLAQPPAGRGREERGFISSYLDVFLGSKLRRTFKGASGVDLGPETPLSRRTDWTGPRHISKNLSVIQTYFVR
jgi:hypothetical protein